MQLTWTETEEDDGYLGPGLKYTAEGYTIYKMAHPRWEPNKILPTKIEYFWGLVGCDGVAYRVACTDAELQALKDRAQANHDARCRNIAWQKYMLENDPPSGGPVGSP